nr:glycoside hydrolase family 3 protein [uncultured Blautia sp.]
MKRVLKERTFSGTTNPQAELWELAHRQIAREAAAEGIVLLKNEDNLLPLKADSAVAIYGAGAGRTIKGGTGSGDVNERENISIWQGMKNAGYKITNEDWIRGYDKIYEKARQDWKNDIVARSGGNGGDVMDFFTIYSTTPFIMPTGDSVKKPADGENTDTAIYALSRVAGEGADRNAAKGDYYLKDDEHQMLSDLCTYYKNVIVAVNAGGQVDLSFMDEFTNIKALLVIVQPGMEGGNAFADVISGKVNPSGKLVDSWAYKYEDYPSAATFSHNNGNVEKEFYTEGIYVGYRYFDTFQIPVRYGFGYGISYTTFAFENVKTQFKDKNNNNNAIITVTVSVKNTGSAAGKEVVQVYTSLPGGILEKEAHRLVAYAKTDLLQPGQIQEMTLEIPVERLTSYDEEKAAWILEKGFYGIFLGNSLESAELIGGAKLDQDVVTEKVKNLFLSEERNELKELTQKNGASVSRERALAVEAAEKALPVLELKTADFTTKKITYKENCELADSEAMDFVNTLSVEELINLAAGDPGKAQGGNLGVAGISVPGSAGETHRCAIDKGLASIVLADGPAGLRLMKYYNVDGGKIISMPFEFSLEGGLFYEGPEELPGERYYQYCTAIPVGTMLAQTWNTELIQQVGTMIGKEMEHFGVTLWLAPGMNIHRNPLCGRNFEYYSEDPYVAGTIAAAMTKGVQSNYGCGTTIKHFACNNQEDNRMGSDSIVSERTLRELYLKGFEIAVKEAQPLSIMTSYNLINGVHAANNHDLCTDVARNEWGFEGMIMTDWTTTERDDSCTASGCMRAGNDLVMPGCFGDHDNMKKELEEGTLKLEDLKACIARLVSVIWKSNQYEESK